MPLLEHVTLVLYGHNIKHGTFSQISINTVFSQTTFSHSSQISHINVPMSKSELNISVAKCFPENIYYTVQTYDAVCSGIRVLIKDKHDLSLR